MHRGDQRLAVGELQLLHRHAALRGRWHDRSRRSARARCCRNRGRRRRPCRPGCRRATAAAASRCPRTLLLLEVPLAALAPAEADRSRAARRSCRVVSSIGDGLPFGIVGLAERLRRSRRRARSGRARRLPSCLHQLHQHRHVGVLADIVAEIRHLPVDVIFLQDHVAHRHGERGIGALLHRQPDVAELRGLRIVGADHGALHAAIARLGVEVRVGRARLRHVRAPQDDEAGIVPVGAISGTSVCSPQVCGEAGGRSQYQS